MPEVEASVFMVSSEPHNLSACGTGTEYLIFSSAALPVRQIYMTYRHRTVLRLETGLPQVIT